MEEHAVELLWMKTHDLTESDDADARAAVLELYLGLLRGQYQKIDVMRAYFFKVSSKAFSHCAR